MKIVVDEEVLFDITGELCQEVSKQSKNLTIDYLIEVIMKYHKILLGYRVENLNEEEKEDIWGEI